MRLTAALRLRWVGVQSQRGARFGEFLEPPFYGVIISMYFFDNRRHHAQQAIG
jgi:hypothetical protein